MKKITTSILVLTLILTITGCSGTVEPAQTVTTSQPASQSTTATTTGSESKPVGEAAAPSPISVNYDKDDLEATAVSSGGDQAASIQLNGDAIVFEGSGATVGGSKITITSAGIYNVSGTLNNGQIIVDTEDKETVELVLNGVNITCADSAPIYVRNADKVVIALADGSQNIVTDGAFYVFEDAESDEPNATIFSKDDLTLKGNGSLSVNANYNNGIASKDDLKITGGNISVNAVNDGIKGRDSIAIKDGVITINAGSDGLQATNDEDAEKGFILIEDGTLNVVAGLDAIQAETQLQVSGGTLTLSAGGGSANGPVRAGDWGRPGGGTNTTAGDAESTKGLKAGVDVTITGGNITIDSADDAIHSNGSLTVSGGEFLLTAGDDGMHSEATLEIAGGNLNIAQSYEGVESAVITINGGSVHIVASDDGINTAGGVDGSGMMGRQNEFAASGNYHLYINGGYIAVDALGDGIDSNGPVDMSGGTVLVNGPTENFNGALDYTGGFNVTGGFLVAVGSSGMAQAPDSSSTQHSVIVNFSSQLAANTLVHIETKAGEGILTFMPTKSYQSVVVCSPELQNGETYVVYTGGSAGGTVVDGLYSDGNYTAGTQFAEFTISDIVTGAGTYSGGGGFPGGGGGRPGRQRP